MNVIRAIGRSAAILAGLVTAAMLAAIGAASDAFAANQPHPGAYPRHPFPFPPHTHAAAGSTPGWQIALVVGGAVLLAAVIAIAGGLLERARAAQRRVATTAA